MGFASTLIWYHNKRHKHMQTNEHKHTHTDTGTSRLTHTKIPPVKCLQQPSVLYWIDDLLILKNLHSSAFVIQKFIYGLDWIRLSPSQETQRRMIEIVRISKTPIH